MTTAYCLSYEYLDYSHSEIIEVSTDKAHILERYNQFVADCKDEEDYDGVDYVSVEMCDAEIDEDGNLDYELEFGNVIAETIFVEPSD